MLKGKFEERGTSKEMLRKSRPPKLADQARTALIRLVTKRQKVTLMELTESLSRERRRK